MLETVFRSPVVRERIRNNPSGDILQRYIGYLVARGHRPDATHHYVFAAEHYCRWVAKRPNRSIDYSTVDRFIRKHLPHCTCERPRPCDVKCVPAALNRLLEMLEIERPPAFESSPVEQLLQGYAHHVHQVCGLSASTVQYRQRYARQLLLRFRVRDLAQLAEWSPHQVARHVAAIGGRHKPSSGQVVASSTRSFLRFLLLRGLIDRDLAAAVPGFANWRLAALPLTVGTEELQKLVAAADLSTPIGMRDQAVVLCMTELGLRTSEVVALTMDGIDLARGTLQFERPKQRDVTRAPLTKRLAKAIDLYLSRGRPSCSTSSLFVVHRAPVGKPLTSLGIHNIVARLARRAGLADRIRGPHVIRHSVATLLINAGASIKEIADLLGHRSVDTTAIYTKVDLRSLAGVALPWPVDVEVLS